MLRFCNPLVLLHLENFPLADLTPERLRAATQRLIAELEINGQRTVPYHGHPLTETTALAALELLENPLQLQLFQRLIQEPDLHNFLHGSWSVSFGVMANSSLWYNPVLRDPLKAYMQPALAQALVQALQLCEQRRTLEIITLVEATPALEALVCYAPAQTWLEAQTATLDTLLLEKDTADYAHKARAIRKDLLDGKAYQVKTLNCLPAYQFGTHLGIFGLSMAGLAQRIFAAEPLFAVKIFSTARLLVVESAVHTQIEGIYTNTAGKWEPPIQEVEPVPPPPRPKPPAPKPKPRLVPPPIPKPARNGLFKKYFLKWKSLTPDQRLAIILAVPSLVFALLYVLLLVLLNPVVPTKSYAEVDKEQERQQRVAYWDSVRIANDRPPLNKEQERRQRLAYWDSVRIANDRPPPEPIPTITLSKPREENSDLLINYAALQRPFIDCLPKRAMHEFSRVFIPYDLYADPEWDAVVFLYNGIQLYDHFYLPKGKMTTIKYHLEPLLTCYVIFGKGWSADCKNPCGSLGYFTSTGKGYETRMGKSGLVKVINDRYSIQLDAAGHKPWESLSDQQIFQRIKRYN